MKQTTLTFLLRKDPQNGREILLAMKKRGFGVGRWNGTGGKLKEGETPAEAAARETEEEIGVKIQPHELTKVAILIFHFAEKPDWDQECHVFTAVKWSGEPSESEEMKPAWYKMEDVPFKDMWVDDPHWLPAVLAGKKVRAEFTFIDGGASFSEKKVEIVNEPF